MFVACLVPNHYMDQRFSASSHCQNQYRLHSKLRKNDVMNLNRQTTNIYVQDNVLGLQNVRDFAPS